MYKTELTFLELYFLAKVLSETFIIYLKSASFLKDLW